MPDKQPLNSKHSKVDRSKADLILRDFDREAPNLLKAEKSNIFRSGITSKVMLKGFGLWERYLALRR